jgi:acetate kinase
MYRFAKRTEHLAEAQNLAAMQITYLLNHRAGVSEVTRFRLAREILRLNRDGEQNVQRLASRAVSLLREHIQKRESALRIAKPSEPA